MPVLMKGADCDAFRNCDVDHLVSDVRDRLCLKTQPERVCPASSHRSAPYQLHRSRHPFHEGLCEQCRVKHHSSPNSLYYHSSRSKTDSDCHRHAQGVSSKPDPSPSSSSYSYCSRRKQCSPQAKAGACRQAHRCQEQDPHVLLEKLLSEQSLIQEAVRRLQNRSSREERMCSAQKLFSLVADVNGEDSNDQFSSQQTPFSLTMSESEDDGVSQHSVDL